MSDLANHLREHADRVAGGGAGEPEYDPETLVLEHDAADRIEALEAEVERLQDYDERLTAVMPPDYKDWHENSREEWPLVAALTIENLTAQSDWAHEELSKSQVEVARLEARVTELEAEVERLRTVVAKADAMRQGIREAGVKRERALYERVMMYDTARAALAGE